MPKLIALHGGRVYDPTNGVDGGYGIGGILEIREV